MNAQLDASIDLNQFYELAREDISKLIGGAAVKAAVIFNASGKDVTFYVYNYIDTVYWVDAQHTLIANEHFGTVAASGAFFKIHPDKNKDEEFLVEPGYAYVYTGPGKLEKVTS